MRHLRVPITVGAGEAVDEHDRRPPVPVTMMDELHLHVQTSSVVARYSSMYDADGSPPPVQPSITVFLPCPRIGSFAHPVYHVAMRDDPATLSPADPDEPAIRTTCANSTLMRT